MPDNFDFFGMENSKGEIIFVKRPEVQIPVT